MPPAVDDGGRLSLYWASSLRKYSKSSRSAKSCLTHLMGCQQSSLGGKSDVVKDFCSASSPSLMDMEPSSWSWG